MNDERTIEALASIWHRKLSKITDDLWVSGDLDADESRAERQVSAWLDARISVVIDLREELSDEDHVAVLAPDITYVNLGTHDNGGPQPDEWFAKGLDVYRWARNHDQSILVLSHMGVSRAPSMAFRMLLEDGTDAVDAARWIRSARPISSLAYALDAFDHLGRCHPWPEESARPRNELREWLVLNEIDVPGIIMSIHRTASQWTT